MQRVREALLGPLSKDCEALVDRLSGRTRGHVRVQGCVAWIRNVAITNHEQSHQYPSLSVRSASLLRISSLLTTRQSCKSVKSEQYTKGHTIHSASLSDQLTEIIHSALT